MSVVLVTGGAGYVGSHAVKLLVADGYQVVVYDDLSAGHEQAIERIADQYPARSVSFVQGDILDAGALDRAIAASRPEAVMHFAARLLVGESVREPFKYYRTNVGGTLNVLEAMARAAVSRFVFSSTCATFGEPLHETLDEEHPQRPINAYGQTKLAVEHALPHIERAAGIRWTALRYFNAAGADPDGYLGEDHQPEEHLIPRAIAAVHGGERLTVFGEDYPTPDGTCVRDYVHVTDLAEAHVAALRRLDAGEPSRAYNLGSGTGMSVLEVLKAVEKAAGRPVPHDHGPRRPGDPARLVAASDRAARELAWRPRFDLDEIVGTAWRWHATHPDGYATTSDATR
ncbi:MAG: UDP-glucose 4-epimerase GalE [Acidobacteria bacterium]|nr:UDP-glucose 4-epimerase GalE [Acidobacteriota bacterium]